MDTAVLAKAVAALSLLTALTGLRIPVTAHASSADGPFARASATAAVGTADRREAARAQTVHLVNRAREAGLSTRHLTWGAVEVDYNGDGRADVWIGRHYRGGALWRNAGGGRYTRVQTDAWPVRSQDGKRVDRHDCAWADVDRNGLRDAYCSAGRFTGNFVKIGRDNELWLQRSPGRFADAGTEWGVGDVCARGRDVMFLDANGDRFPDLFVGTQVPRHQPDPCNRHPRRYPNEHSKLFINRGGDGFRYAKRMFDYGAGRGSRCAEPIDFDHDGWTDILACGPEGTPPRLFRNRQGHGFADASAKLHAPRVNDAVVGDIDGDRRSDIVMAADDAFYYALNTGVAFAPSVALGGTPNGVGRTVAVGDADGDGDLDVYGGIHRLSSNPDDRLFLNDGLAFTGLVPPSAPGKTDDVIPLHVRPGAPVQFLVLNGLRHTPRPNLQVIQLVGL